MFLVKLSSSRGSLTFLLVAIDWGSSPQPNQDVVHVMRSLFPQSTLSPSVSPFSPGVFISAPHPQQSLNFSLSFIMRLLLLRLSTKGLLLKSAVILRGMQSSFFLIVKHFILTNTELSYLAFLFFWILNISHLQALTILVPFLLP